MTRFAMLLAFQSLVISGCLVGPEPGDSPQDGSGAAVPTSSGRIMSAKPLPATGTVVGVLGMDAVEGGCAFLEAGDGKRYQVLWPDGWSLDRATGQLFGPDGQVARPGDVVTVRGAIATEIGTICQVGAVFRATEVVSIGG